MNDRERDSVIDLIAIRIVTIPFAILHCFWLIRVAQSMDIVSTYILVTGASLLLGLMTVMFMLTFISPSFNIFVWITKEIKRWFRINAAKQIRN